MNEFIDDWAVFNPTECLICHGHRTAYSWPPVCADCLPEWEIECTFNRLAREEREPLPLLAMGGE